SSVFISSARISSGSPFGPRRPVLLQKLPGVRHHLVDGAEGHEPLRPRRQVREPGPVQKVGARRLVHRSDPNRVAPERDVHEPDGVAAEERLPPGALRERPLQRLRHEEGVLERLRSLLVRPRPEQRAERREELETGKGNGRTAESESSRTDSSPPEYRTLSST
uniref:Uncharacterized protein n=1 Tax=Zea mays TaxID=4577 RepID=A0A804NEW3_MAIZE